MISNQGYLFFDDSKILIILDSKSTSNISSKEMMYPPEYVKLSKPNVKIVIDVITITLLIFSDFMSRSTNIKIVEKCIDDANIIPIIYFKFEFLSLLNKYWNENTKIAVAKNCLNWVTFIINVKIKYIANTLLGVLENFNII